MENTVEQVRIEVEDDHVVVVFPGMCDDFITPYQEAWIFGETLEKAAEDIPNKPVVLNAVQVEIEQYKIRLKATSNKKCIAFIFDHTDRIKLSYEAARVVARAIRQVAQDLDFENNKKVYMRYNVKGREGRPTPFWDENRFPKTLRTR